VSATAADLLRDVDPRDVEALRHGELADPHRVLGAHPAGDGVVVRAFHPEASGCDLCVGDRTQRLETVAPGLFAGRLAGVREAPAYRLRFRFEDGNVWEREDPYRFLPTLGDLDVHLIGEGRHRRLWEALGARVIEHGGRRGVAFSVWAPNARRVSLVGDFCGWDGRLLPMRCLGASGVWELFVPGLDVGALYKFEIKTREGALRLKTDPLARSMELPPGSAGRVARSEHVWSDGPWLDRRAKADPHREPVSIYEVHLGSFARVPEEGDRFLGYREIAPRLIDHARRMGFTHVELLPVAEHAFYGSWGYQVTGYYAPTCRYGDPDDLRYLVDRLHEAELGVILDWVPAHFPRDDFALRRFDGTALYEHDDPRRGEHPDWGTLIFNYGRAEVRNFLVANALYWLREFHVDGLRVDAVASMLYLDYSREAGEWLPNQRGGRENLEAISLLQEINRVVSEEVPGAITIAEESTAWPGVTRPPEEGGLGFDFKWNMGWMHDTLEYFRNDPIHRRWAHDQLSFAMVYEYDERFVNPLSHDEVVHGKGSLYAKMPGDPWQKLANLRALLGYQWLRPGKMLLFMGSELAPEQEWSHDRSLDWHLLERGDRQGMLRWVEALGALYREHACLWRRDPEPAGFAWIDHEDRESSVFAFERRDGDAHLVVVMNLTPLPREGYRIGAPARGAYRTVLSSDDATFGGSGLPRPDRVVAEAEPCHGRDQSLVLTLPPLSVLVLAPEPDAGDDADGADVDEAPGPS
jgi:1,4-alpha-glucan branching enzyme